MHGRKRCVDMKAENGFRDTAVVNSNGISQQRTQYTAERVTPRRRTNGCFNSTLLSLRSGVELAMRDRSNNVSYVTAGLFQWELLCEAIP